MSLIISYFVSKVTEDSAKILMAAGYECECRGPTYVKGKGTLTTYFVKTQYDENWSPIQLFCDNNLV